MSAFVGQCEKTRVDVPLELLGLDVQVGLDAGLKFGLSLGACSASYRSGFLADGSWSRQGGGNEAHECEALHFELYGTKLLVGQETWK